MSFLTREVRTYVYVPTLDLAATKFIQEFARHFNPSKKPALIIFPQSRMHPKNVCNLLNSISNFSTYVF